MKYFPAFVDLNTRRCLVVGGGEMALKKAHLLKNAGADLTIMSPEFELDFADALGLSADQVLDFSITADEAVSQGFVLVVAASGIADLDEAIAAAARRANVPVNVVDRTDLCTFIMPSIVDRGDVVIGISTSGASPVLARRIRAKIEAALPARVENLAAFARSFRESVKTKLKWEQRRDFWERVIDGPIGQAVLNGREAQAREDMLTAINQNAGSSLSRGRVSIVGTGPGDPDLLTLKALHVMQDADVILYDKLIGPKILEYARRDAIQVFVGKSRACHYKTQDEINDLMISHAEVGRHVVRLKGGDPFIFGRGGEEVDILKRRNIDVSVVPGVTAASGCAASSEIPLTHRDHAKSVTFVTGHGRDGEPDLDWRALAAEEQTIVVYMGVANAQTISRRLVEHGLSMSTPVAVVVNGTLDTQKTVTSTLAKIADEIAATEIDGPALMIVGDVVSAQSASKVDVFADAVRRIA